MSDMIRLGRLWKGTDRTGRAYLSGVQARDLDAAIDALRAGGRLLVLPNGRKRDGHRDPDCELYVVPDRQPAPARRTAPADDGGFSDF